MHVARRSAALALQPRQGRLPYSPRLLAAKAAEACTSSASSGPDAVMAGEETPWQTLSNHCERIVQVQHAACCHIACVHCMRAHLDHHPRIFTRRQARRMSETGRCETLRCSS
jgi:hypothetical protein